MSNKILFGNNVGYIVNNFLIKKKIINFLLRNVNNFNLNKSYISSEDDLLEIKNNNYKVFPNIVGDEFIFISVKLNNKYFVILVDKKTLNLEKINYNDLRVISVRIRLKECTYKGTIFDGRIVNVGGCCIFIINNIFMINGKNLENDSFNVKFKLTEDFINESYIIDSNMNTILFKLNKTFDVNDLNFLINDKIENSKFKFSSIDFIKENSKVYRYYLNNVDLKENYASMLAKKINTDIIELYSRNKDNKIKRIGLAHLPDIKSSQLFNFHVPTNKLCQVKCKLNYRFKKWVPQEIFFENTNIDSYENIKNLMLL